MCVELSAGLVRACIVLYWSHLRDRLGAPNMIHHYYSGLFCCKEQKNTFQRWKILPICFPDMIHPFISIDTRNTSKHYHG